MRRLLVLGLAALLVLGSCGSDSDPESPGATWKPLSVFDGPPPWALAGQQAARMDAAGTPKLRAEGQAVHYHAHIDVFYNGEEVLVPKNIGVDFEESVISPLHTHFDGGVIHVEAAEAANFTLAQFLTQWGVKNGDGCVADKCGAEVVVFLDGSIQDDPVEDIVIPADAQIALVLGTPPADIPSGYDCSTGPPQDACPDTPKP